MDKEKTLKEINSIIQGLKDYEDVKVFAEKAISLYESEKYDILDNYAKNNAPYPVGSIVKVKFMFDGSIKSKICKVLDFWADEKLNIHPVTREMKKYKSKCTQGGKPFYYVADKNGFYCEEILDVKVLNADKYPTCSCDTCLWLEAYQNTKGSNPILHCSITIDGEAYEEGRPACDRYNYWNWSSCMGNVTHREQIIRDCGEESQAEKNAREIFSSVLEGMAENKSK